MAVQCMQLTAALHGPSAACSVFLTNALPANILFIAHVALAAVAGRRWDAASVQTQVGEVFAHVHRFIHSNGA